MSTFSAIQVRAIIDQMSSTRDTQKPVGSAILTINAGSSSIRFAVYGKGPTMLRHLSGKIERIGLRGTSLVAGAHPPVTIPSGADAVDFLLAWLEAQPIFAGVKAAGHRVVHGMKHSQPERVAPKLLAELRRIIPYASEHLPREIDLIETLRKRHPRMPQVACFDTAFHRTLPAVAKLLPLPWRYTKQGVERYGFHGLSCAYLMETLGRLDPSAPKGRVILAHLGNGSSVTAVRNGKSVDTSMGFTPAAGLVMSTRTGDLDPGLIYFLAHKDGMTPARFHRMVNHESGLLGISGTSSDMRDLLDRESSDARAALAVALFCQQAKKWIGSFAAVLGGIDTLVFAGGIGENSPVIRERICEGLGFLGVLLDKKRNTKSDSVISADGAGATVRVIPTDEEFMIARLTARVMR